MTILYSFLGAQSQRDEKPDEALRKRDQALKYFEDAQKEWELALRLAEDTQLPSTQWEATYCNLGNVLREMRLVFGGFSFNW